MSERAAELGISPQKIEPQSEANEGSVGPGRLVSLRSRIDEIRVQPNLLPAPARRGNNRQVAPSPAVRCQALLLLSFTRTPF